MDEQDKEKAGNMVGYLVAFALIVLIGYHVARCFS